MLVGGVSSSTGLPGEASTKGRYTVVYVCVCVLLFAFVVLGLAGNDISCFGSRGMSNR